MATNEEKGKCMSILAHLMGEFTKEEGRARSMVHLKAEEEQDEVLVMTFIGKKQIDRLLPSVQKLCPEALHVQEPRKVEDI